MKYWASNFAIIPIEKDPGLASLGGVSECDWIPSGISSWILCGEHHRKLFLQLLFGSVFLVAGFPPVQASGVVYKCMRACVHTLNPQLDAGSVLALQSKSERLVAEKEECLSACPSSVSAASPSKSNIAHRTSHIAHRKSNIAHQTSNIKHPSLSPKSQTTAVIWRGGDMVSSLTRSHAHALTPAPLTPYLSSNGAILAHQTTSLSVPLPTARNGVATSIPLPEAWERDNKMDYHFQICTKGYLASPGIPVPASGLYIWPGAPIGGKVRCKNVKDGQSPSFCTHTPIHLYTYTPIPIKTPKNHEQNKTNHTTYFFQYQYRHLYET